MNLKARNIYLNGIKRAIFSQKNYKKSPSGRPPDCDTFGLKKLPHHLFLL